LCVPALFFGCAVASAVFGCAFASAVFGCAFASAVFGCAVGHVHFSFARPKEKQNQRERPPAVSPRLKIERFSLKRANALRFAPFGRARFFTGKSSDFLHASPKKAGTG
jgi:hypothetical protein